MLWPPEFNTMISRLACFLIGKEVVLRMELKFNKKTLKCISIVVKMVLCEDRGLRSWIPRTVSAHLASSIAL